MLPSSLRSPQELGDLMNIRETNNTTPTPSTDSLREQESTSPVANASPLDLPEVLLNFSLCLDDVVSDEKTATKMIAATTRPANKSTTSPLEDISSRLQSRPARKPSSHQLKSEKSTRAQLRVTPREKENIPPARERHEIQNL